MLAQISEQNEYYSNFLDITRGDKQEILYNIDVLCDNLPSESLFNIFYNLSLHFNNNAEISEYLGEILSNYILKYKWRSLKVLKNFDDEKLDKLIYKFLFVEGTSEIIMSYILEHYLYNNNYFKFFRKYY